MVPLLSVVGVVTALALTGFFYQLIGSRRDRQRYARGGRWIEIGRGRKHYLLEKGSGGPTVLFEAGIAATNLNWFFIQEAVSSFAYTASYDRAGLGWSSPSRSSRTPTNIAKELHALLACAQVKPPYVLVGHSFGGLVMRRFALLYPEEALGVVLVDPMRCEEWPPLDPSKQSQIDLSKRLFRFAIPVARFGIARLAATALLGRSKKISGGIASAAGDGGRHVLNRVTEEVGKLPRELWPVIAGQWSRPECYAGMRRHVQAVPETVREMMDAEPIRGVPVVVLTPGKAEPLSDEQLRRIGDDVRQVIAPASAHWIHLDEPGLVIDAIREMVESRGSVAVASREATPTVG